MKSYSWTSEYVAAVEEHDYAELQRRIAIARRLMSDRFSALMDRSMTDGEYEELRQLRDARRALDLLERVSNDGNLFEAETQRPAAPRQSA